MTKRKGLLKSLYYNLRTSFRFSRQFVIRALHSCFNIHLCLRGFLNNVQTSNSLWRSAFAKVNSHYQRPNECPADGKKMSSAHSKEQEVVCNKKATEGDSAEAEISEKRDKGRVKEALRESLICLEHCNSLEVWSLDSSRINQ